MATHLSMFGFDPSSRQPLSLKLIPISHLATVRTAGVSNMVLVIILLLKPCNSRGFNFYYISIQL